MNLHREKWAETSEKGRLIAYWQDLSAYYRDNNDEVWSYQRGWSNLGAITNEVLNKRYRVTEFVEVTK